MNVTTAARSVRASLMAATALHASVVEPMNSIRRRAATSGRRSSSTATPSRNVASSDGRYSEPA